jgi:hypothetical protein
MCSSNGRVSGCIFIIVLGPLVFELLVNKDEFDLLAKQITLPVCDVNFKHWLKFVSMMFDEEDI